MSDRTDRLEARKTAIKAELDKRKRPLSDTERQLLAARGHTGRPIEPDYKPEAEWSTTDRQVFSATGRKPLADD